MNERLPVRYVDPDSRNGHRGWSQDREVDEWGEQPGGSSLDARGILAALRRSYWLVALAAVIGLGVGIYRSSEQEPVYRATAVIQFETAADNPAAGLGLALPSRRVNDVVSQLHILRSQTVLGAVVDSTGLRLRRVEPEDARPGIVQFLSLDAGIEDGERLEVTFGADQVTARLGTATGAAAYGDVLDLGAASLRVPARPLIPRGVWAVGSRSNAISGLDSRLDATQRPQTQIVDVRYISNDPGEAARVVNTAMRVFQEHTATVARNQFELRRDFVEDQLRLTDSLLQDAQIALASFHQRERLGSARARIDAIEGQRVTLEMRRAEMAADVAMYSSLLEQLEAAEDPGVSPELETFATVPGILANPIVAQQFGQLVGYENERRTLTTGEYGISRNAPEIVRLDTLIALTHRSLTRAVRSHLTGLGAMDQRLASMDSLGAENMADLAPRPGVEFDEQRLTLQVEMLTQQAQRVRQERQQIAMAEAVEGGGVQIIDEATPPGGALAVARRRTEGMGLLAGLLVGLAGALLREVLNKTIRRREELEELLNIPALAVIPSIASGKKRYGKKKKGKESGGAKAPSADAPGLITFYDARSPSAEAFRGLRTNLVFSRSYTSMKTLMVTSASASEGKSTIAANLAITYAQQGARTILVDCDVRHPSLDQVFDIERRPGLTDWIQARNPSKECVRATDVPGLWLLPAGSIPANPVEFLGSDLMGKALAVLRDQFDVVILDTCPVLVAADPLVLGVRADGVVFVVRADQTHRDAAQNAVAQLTRVGARVAGAVLNDPDGALPMYGSYYYTGNYDYYGIEPEDVRTEGELVVEEMVEPEEDLPSVTLR